jgi:hypothetical protein
MIQTILFLTFFDVGFLVIELNELRKGVRLTHLVHVDDGITGPDIGFLLGRLGVSRGGGRLCPLLLDHDRALFIEVTVVLTFVCPFLFEDGNVLREEFSFTVYN